MRDGLSREEVTEAVAGTVEDLLRAAGVTTPPVDALALARHHLGMTISLDEPQGRPRRSRRPDDRPYIVLRPEATEERNQWAVAHEIGAHLKQTILQRLGIEPAERRPLMGASLPNLFAHHLLVPACWFRDDAPAADYDVLQLKERYRTAGHDVIALRLLDLPEPCIITIVDNDHIDRRRSNAWPVRKRLEPAEQECQRYVHDCSRPKVVRAGGWTVQGWPVHGADWKREILRSVVEEGCESAEADEPF